jgi:hypothetical protein
MREIGLFLFPWDLADEGIERVMGFAAESGITTLYMASVYHAGLFLQPHNPVHKVHMLEDGVAYFHPNAELYGSIQPEVARISRQTDWFQEAGDHLGKFGLRLSAWTVCMHNSRLGEAWPAMVVRNAFRDPRPYALCPSHPEVQRYVRALLRDLSRYPLASLLLEAFRYMDVVHGAHHERWSIPLPPLERTLLSMSFAPADLTAAAHAGIDGSAARERTKAHLERFFATYPKLPGDLPRTWQEFEQACPEATTYRNCLRAVMDQLLDSIRADLNGQAIELIGQGQQDFNITCSPGKPGFDAILCSVYDQGPDEAAASIRRAKETALPAQKVYANVKLGFGAIASAADLADIVAAVEEAGADAILFYNYAECSRTVLDWIAPALKGRRR